MERGYRSYILLAFLTCICTASAGCLSGLSGSSHYDTATILVTPALPTPESPIATIPAADMALQLTDMPPDYVLRDRTASAYAGVSRIFRDLGWLQGYQVSFYRLDKDRDDMTGISQEIGVYPLDTVKEVYAIEKEALLPPDDSATDYQVPFPQQGDRSIAWREIRTIDHTTFVTYTVIFTKKNVYEKISMTGTTTDYEILKDITQKAAGKIR
ncbi:MAG: hypothetical protein LUQ71_03330 [Methanoregula sp.]|nr:hypothetical protein [Methanoregula sp.]